MARKALRYIAVFALLALALFLTGSAQEPQASQPEPKIDWQPGPGIGDLGGIAQIKIPAGYLFTGKAGAQKVLELTHNPASGKELGVLIPDSTEFKWFMTFEFWDRGYVKDDDKDSLDADAMLKGIQKGTEDANEERKQRGWKPFHVIGWERAPFYDPLTHNLTWAIRGRGDDSQEVASINHSIRLLGRRGTMDVDLVASPTRYAASIGEFNSLISGFSYLPGNRYSDFTKGDKTAEYGLAGLVVAGGAGFVLLKFWKPIVVGIAALGAAIKRFFGRIFGSKETKIQPPQPPPQAAVQG